MIDDEKIDRLFNMMIKEFNIGRKDEKYCLYCDRKRKPDWEYCPYCGAQVLPFQLGK